MNSNSPFQNFLLNSLRIMLFLTFLLAFIYLVDGVANQSSLLSQKTGMSFDGKTLITSLFSFMAALSSLWSVVTARKSAEEIEKLKKQSAQQIEELKQQLTIQFPALTESRSAALSYYRGLSNLVEIENLDTTSLNPLEECEKTMLKAEGSIYFLSEEYQRNWYSYWQRVDFISKNIKNQSDFSERKKQWREDWSKQLTEKLNYLTNYTPVNRLTSPGVKTAGILN